MFAWRKLKVGAPTPTMAIEQAKKIRETVKAPGARRQLTPADADPHPDEIRASIEANREGLGESLDSLRGEVVALTDWRAQLAPTRPRRLPRRRSRGSCSAAGSAA